jgi:hypothetical protein
MSKVRLQSQERTGGKAQKAREQKADRLRCFTQGDGRGDRRRAANDQHRVPAVQERHGILVDAPDKVGRRSYHPVLPMHKVQPHLAELRLISDIFKIR